MIVQKPHSDTHPVQLSLGVGNVWMRFSGQIAVVAPTATVLAPGAWTKTSVAAGTWEKTSVANGTWTKSHPDDGTWEVD